MLEIVGFMGGQSRRDQPVMTQRAEAIFDRYDSIAKEARLLAEPLSKGVTEGRKRMAETSSSIIMVRPGAHRYLI